MFGWLKKKMGGARESAAPPIPQGPLPEAQLRTALERPCAPLTFRKPANIDPLATMFGAVRLERRGEVWPCYHAAPLWPLCQINLTDAPNVPDIIADLSLITIFIQADSARAPTQIIDTANPDPNATWALRCYTSLDGLTIPQQHDHGSRLSARMGDWDGVQPDYANHDVAGTVVDTQTNDIYSYDWCQTVPRTKLGGWPATVQSEPWWHYTAGPDTWEFVLQIENEPKADWHGWGDGAAYIARSRERPHLWAIDVQFT